MMGCESDDLQGVQKTDGKRIDLQAVFILFGNASPFVYVAAGDCIPNRKDINLFTIAALLNNISNIRNEYIIRRLTN